MKKSALALLVTIAACAGPAATSTTKPAETTAIPETVPQTPPSTQLTSEQAIDLLLEEAFTTGLDPSRLETVVAAGDEGAAWVLADLLRFFQTGPQRDELVIAFTRMTGTDPVLGQVDFVWTTNHLIESDTPAPPNYSDIKRRLYSALDPRWAPLFESDDDMDWRLVTWGGVGIDDRPLGDNGPCNCIPALDDPTTTDASEGDWYSDDRIVFGIVVGDEALALPRHQMEVHEMVNVTVGGRDLGIPYCTLCGSAQAYFTDEGARDRVVLRTSGLLSRSNKVMYDLITGSVFDTFTGVAKTGPLAEQGVALEQTTVITSTWGDWKEAHPDTRILARDGGVGRVYADDPLRGRDDNGPIFPVGDIDDRLRVQEAVIGVIAPGGTPIAFPVEVTRTSLEQSGAFEYAGVRIELIDGIRIFDSDGTELPTHQAFWFAWSQFHPDTSVWSEG